MKREWKPGEVAMVKGLVCIRSNEGMWEHGRSDRFRYPGGTPSARPLVVIDPEDREQVERLHDALAAAGYCEDFADRLQAALRELANPTPLKPDEPRGLGAVVEDEDGFAYVRHYPSDTDMTHTWFVVDRNCNKSRLTWKWDEFAAVRVLSEGVTP